LEIVPEQLAYYESILREISSSELEQINKYFGNQLPYRWEFRTRVEPIEYFATVELTASDILTMNSMNDGQKREYLGTKFGEMLNPVRQVKIRKCSISFFPWGVWRPQDASYTIQIIAKDQKGQVAPTHFFDINSFRMSLASLGIDLAQRNEIVETIETGKEYVIGDIGIEEEALDRFSFPI
jgi:hypothetical protein